MKPTVVISRCLGFEACRWDGSVIESFYIKQLKKYVNVVTVCPEVAIGLGVPRNQLNLVKKEKVQVIQKSNNRDLTEELSYFSKNFLGSLSHVDGFVLKSKSPSCGNDTTIIQSDNGKKLGSGIFAETAKNIFPNAVFIDENDIKSKKNFERFLKLISKE
jgi:uncharacterized protein YbbK (DUF523 family)